MSGRRAGPRSFDRRRGPLWIAERGVSILWLGWPRHMALDHMPARPCLRTSSDERHKSGPYGDQTKCHPGNSDISAHRPSPSLHRMARARGWCCDLSYSPRRFFSGEM
jgi:hypothetical protein